MAKSTFTAGRPLIEKRYKFKIYHRSKVRRRSEITIKKLKVR